MRIRSGNIVKKKPTDRATRCVSRNPVNCCTTVRTSCTINPLQIDVVESEHCGRRTCARDECITSTVQPRRGDRRKFRQQARPSKSFVDNAINLPWRNFLSPEFEAKFHSKVPLSLEIPTFPQNLAPATELSKRVSAILVGWRLPLDISISSVVSNYINSSQVQLSATSGAKYCTQDRQQEWTQAARGTPGRDNVRLCLAASTLISRLAQ